MLGEVGGFGQEGTEGGPVAFDGVFFPSTAGMAILDGAYRGLPFLLGIGHFCPLESDTFYKCIKYRLLERGHPWNGAFGFISGDEKL